MSQKPAQMPEPCGAGRSAENLLYSKQYMEPILMA